MSANEFMGNVRNNWRQRSTEKTSFKNELRLVPRWLVTLVVALYVVALVVAELVNLAGARGVILQGPVFPDFGAALSGLAVAGVVTLAAAFLGSLILLYGYIYGDAKRRGMTPGLWLIVSIFVPYLIGVIIYFIVREPLPFNCPRCEAAVTSQFNFCPRCQLNLRPSCPQCRREIRSGDRYCPHCGAGIDTEVAVQAAPPGAPVATSVG
ncbi:MAG TPA: zinc ribbon domain-containing protein [Terriglobia bacterium]|nr:zinc ribbon domain-containing protein [Terriglobia bacterium]